VVGPLEAEPTVRFDGFELLLGVVPGAPDLLGELARDVAAVEARLARGTDGNVARLAVSLATTLAGPRGLPVGPFAQRRRHAPDDRTEGHAQPSQHTRRRPVGRRPIGRFVPFLDGCETHIQR